MLQQRLLATVAATAVLLGACANDSKQDPPGTESDLQSIVGGWNATRGDQPWMAGLLNLDDREIWCGGTLVHPRFVLSAAHCFVDFDSLPRDQTRMVFNELDVRRGADWEVEQMRRIRDVHPHPSYARRTTEDSPISAHDLVLVELESPVVLNEYVYPVQLTSESAEGYRVLGWGALNGDDEYPTMLQEGYVSELLSSGCTDANLWVGPNQFCAGTGPWGGVQDTCSGDSGGPALVGGWDADARLAGVVSRGTKYCSGFGVYTRVGPYIGWVNDTIARRGG